MAKARVLALIRKDPIFKETCGRINKRKEQLKQKMEFIKKQAENAIKEMMDQNEPDWDIIKDHLREIDALDTYNKKTHHLSFSLESNAIELVENCDEN